MKIIHAADIHLGRQRLDGRLPDADFEKAFAFIVQTCLEEKADLFLLAGDLFDRPHVAPQHLRQAQRVLRRLKEAGIPTLAIEGNHDRASINSTEPTWLEFLADDDLLILLTTRFTSAGPILEEWDPVLKRGSWIDREGIRFLGAGYLGAATPYKLRQVVDRMTADMPHVLLLHAGPDYFVGEGGGFSSEDLAMLNEKVAYLALGHIHKPMLHGGWACNPGSPENCDVYESNYDKEGAARGYAVVEITRNSRLKPDQLEIRSTPRRPCVHLTLDCTELVKSAAGGAMAIEEAASKMIGSKALSADSVVALRLTGRLNLSQVALDLARLAASLEQTTGLKAICIDASGLNLGAASTVCDPALEAQSREQIEREAIKTVVSEGNLWNPGEDSETVASFLYDIKQAVQLGASAERLTEMIRATPLLGRLKFDTEKPMDRGNDNP